MKKIINKQKQSDNMRSEVKAFKEVVSKNKDLLSLQLKLKMSYFVKILPIQMQLTNIFHILINEIWIKLSQKKIKLTFNYLNLFLLFKQ